MTVIKFPSKNSESILRRFAKQRFSNMYSIDEFDLIELDHISTMKVIDACNLTIQCCIMAACILVFDVSIYINQLNYPILIPFVISAFIGYISHRNYRKNKKAYRNLLKEIRERQQ